MTKRYNSGRVQRLPQSGITSDRYEFLGLEQAEPDLGDPIVGVSSVEAHPFNGSIYDWYLVGSDGSGQGKRYWLPKHIVLADFTRTAGSVTIRSNDTVIGFANGISDLNFKGGISVVAPGSVAGIGNSAVDIFIENVPEADRADQADSLGGGSPGSIPYQESADNTVFLPGAGAERQVLSYDTSSTAPIWRNILALNPIEAEEKLNDQIYYLSYLVSAGSTSTIGISSSGLTFNASQVKLGIGTDLPSSTLDVNGDLNIVGLATFSSDLDINASINVSGHSELGSVNVTGISTFNLVNVIGISTFNDTVGINSTLTVSGISSFVNNVSISKTDALLNVASQSVFTGLTTVNTLTANALSPDGIDYGTNLYVPVANNSGSWSWQQVFDAGAGSIDGISIFENSTLKGEDIITLDFQNPNYSITVDGTDATIVFSNNPTFNTVSVGPGSEVGISSSGINVVGVVTSTKAIIGTGVTIDSSGVNVSGIITTTSLKVNQDLTVDGNLTVNGNTTTINSTTITVDDKHIELASTASPSDVTADGGGLILKGGSDHTILWNNTYDSWNFSEHVNIAFGKEYRINNNLVLDSTTLGAGVTNSSLKTLGTIITGVWEGTQINDDYIGIINNSNKVDLNALDIDGGTETTTIVDADLFIVDDGANGTNRKVTASNIKSYIGSNLSLSGSLSGNLDLNGYNITGLTGNINITENIKAGIITATSGFYGTLTGNVTGTATTATNLNRDVTAGNGLTGGGTLTSTVTLDVGAGTGITVNADDIALKNAGSLTNNKVLKWDGTQLTNTNITDNGTLVTIGSTIKLGGIQDSTNSTGSTNYVPIANGSGGWSWAQINASSVSGALQNIVEDTTPQLGGDLDLNSKNINGTGNINITGIITASNGFVGNLTGTATTATNLNRDVTAGNGLAGGGTLTSNVTLNVGAGTGITVNADDIALKNAGSLTNNKVLKWDGTQLVNSNIEDTGALVSVGTTIKLGGLQDSGGSAGSQYKVPIANGSGGWAWDTISADNVTGALQDVVNDTTPQLGGDLDLNSKNINGTGNIDITGNIKAGIITATSSFVGNLTGTATTANNLNRDVTAGNGLTGGGTLTSNVTLNIGAGTGITVNADNIALKNAGSLTNNKVLKWDGVQLVNSNIEDTGSIVGVGTSIKLNFGIIDKNNSTGQIQYIPVADGNGGWTWNSLAGAGGIGGISVREETDSPFTGITELKFVGINVTATANSNVATITVADTVSAATTAANLTRNVDAPSDGGLTGGGTLTSNLNIRLKNYNNLSTNTLLKWQGTNKELTNSLITENGSLVGVGTSIKLEYGIFDKNNSVGANKNIPVADGNGGWSWGTITSAGGITGITISEEGNAVSASSFTNINFVSPNITATDGGSGIATVTLSSTPTFTEVDVTGITTTLNLNVTGIATIPNLEVININSTGIITATQLSTGAYGTGINIYSNGTINGPSEIIIDPAAIDNNTGSVRVKGDLYVDGSQFIVNSTTIELADFIVGIASTATTDTLADGAGIKIGPDNTILYDNTNTAFKSSENFNLVSGKTYKINGTDVLTSNTLGSGVVNSSLTSVGTLVKLDVGNINATGIVTAATYDVSSDINLKDNVQIIENPLDKIVKIDGVTFNWKADNKPSMGVIAQNIEEVLPELVSTGDTKHVNYNGIIGLLIEAIKELKSEIDELKGNK
jgi:hypothetical protein